MNKLFYTLLVSIFITLSASAQLKLADDQELSVSGLKSELKITLGVSVEESSDVGDFDWKVIREDGTPESWEYSICDGNTCFLPGIEAIPDNYTNNVDGSLHFEFHLSPNNTEGNFKETVVFFEDDNEDNVLFTFDIDWDIVGSVNTIDFTSSEDLVLYPNPTSDFFYVKNDANVAKVTIHSILGRELASYNHEVGQYYSVESYADGIYLARLFDNDGKVIKVLRFNKK